jgi:hypothetical protein
MQKLSATTPGKNNKSCGIFHNESNKIDFAFFWFSYNFLHNVQESAKALYYFRFIFAAGPWKVLDSYIYTLTLQIGPQQNSNPCNWVLGDGSGGPAEIPAGDRRIPAGGQQGSGLGPTRVRFVGMVGGEEPPAVGRTGVWRWWPLRLPAPASLRPGKATGGGGRFQEG